MGFAGILAAASLLYWSFVSNRETQPLGDAQITKAPGPTVTPAATSNPRGYLGIQACQTCHAARVKEFKETRHYLACMPPDPSQMPAAITSGEGKLTTSDPHLHFEMVKAGDDYIQKAIRTPADGPPQVTSTVVSLVYGQGGIADQVYFGWRGNQLLELPVVRLLPQNEWGASKFDKNGGGDLAREATARCLECHNVWFQQTPGTLSEYDRQDMLLGVTCEKCHGPGHDHAAWHQDHPGAKSGQEIVHPGKLSRESLMAVCGQCHSNAAKYAAEPFTYTPGEPLEKYFKILDSPFPEDDHVANQDEYLRQSKCFQHSEMTCITCHDPHHREEVATAKRQQTCLQCHAEDKCTDRPNLPAPVRDDCIGCHMPLANKVQVHFFTAGDDYVPPAIRYEHRIGIYPLERKEKLLHWQRKKADPESKLQVEKLEQDLAGEWIAQGDALREAHRFLPAIDAFRRAQRIRPSDAARKKLAAVIELNSRIDRGWYQAAKEIQEQRFAEAARTLEEVLSIKPDLGMAHGKLGSVYASLGQKEKAREHFEVVSRFDPGEPYGEYMLGWTAYLDSQHGEAIEHYLRAEEMEPRNVKMKYHRGMAHLGASQWDNATAAFEKVLVLDPKHSGAYQGLSHAQRGLGQNKEAVKNARRAAELTGFRNADILISLADAYADTGRLEEAKKTASQALAASQGGNPQAIAQIMAKIEEFQKRAGGSR